ncbi:hypothetical protein CPSG_10115 [Coccidioides posadasii str. Silveira]|uniref:Uncharacterized protein n=1 Tax=Coccidioides posadasii (strain RMSCC 757 / Silveira) TaxID=443226 RepID=E9DJW6_COCPS|nr:hypothetical protein CPSG_10115 [Coccidioides posadasii str. Silveira]
MESESKTPPGAVWAREGEFTGNEQNIPINGDWVRLRWPVERDLATTSEDDARALDNHITNCGFGIRDVPIIVQLGHRQYDVFVANPTLTKFVFVNSHLKIIPFATSDYLADHLGKVEAANEAAKKLKVVLEGKVAPGTANLIQDRVLFYERHAATFALGLGLGLRV